MIGYARCSTVLQDLTTQREILTSLGVPEDRIYLDKRLTGTNRERPGLDQALAAVHAGDTLVVPELDRLARSVPDARDIGDTLVARGVRLCPGGSIYDPADPMSKMFFNLLAVFAEFEADLLKMRTREGMAKAITGLSCGSPSFRISGRGPSVVSQALTVTIESPHGTTSWTHTWTHEGCRGSVVSGPVCGAGARRPP
ncbi:recombinase family protein [Nonomuraea lactucae]|uniref:recombinase family protein n=1 Tax=Nonomuraea lactucae TaxID=2249762 RepID=UPI001F05957F|nr:recombinase family protein [Nonomuraea lactucae]